MSRISFSSLAERISSSRLPILFWIHSSRELRMISERLSFRLFLRRKEIFAASTWKLRPLRKQEKKTAEVRLSYCRRFWFLTSALT